MKIQTLIEHQEPSRLYRGSTRVYRPGDLMSSRPRDSISGSGNILRDLWDNIAVKSIPALHGTAPRSNCVICTRIEYHAENFGFSYEVEVDHTTSKIVWANDDFNHNPTQQKLVSVLRDVATVLRMTPEVSFDMIGALQEGLDGSSDLQQHWREQLGADAPTDILQYAKQMFEELINKNVYNVVSSIEDVPHNAPEIWFSGALKVVAATEYGEREDW